MPLTTYAPGDVLTAASLNANLVFAAANPTGGLTFINTTSFAAATSVSLPANTFSATYANYKIDLQITALTADAVFSMRLRAASVDNTTSVYETMFMGIDTGGTARNSVGATLTSFSMGEEDAGAFATEYTLTLDVKNPQLTLPTTLLGSYAFVDRTPTFRAIRVGGGVFQSTTSFDSLTFISSIASSMSGVVRVYGYSLS